MNMVIHCVEGFLNKLYNAAAVCQGTNQGNHVRELYRLCSIHRMIAVGLGCAFEHTVCEGLALGVFGPAPRAKVGRISYL